MKNNNSYQQRNNNNNNSRDDSVSSRKDNYQNDRRRQQNRDRDRDRHQPDQHHQSQNPNHRRNQDQRSQERNQQPIYQQQRDPSGQRNQSGQYPDSSVGREYSNNQLNLGSVKFSPGYPTRELPPIETKADPTKKFTGRCRLFVGNLPHNTTEEKLKKLFEQFGEVGECFLGPKSAFAFIKMDTRANAEAARDALDTSAYEGRTIRVRVAAHAAAIRVKNLSPHVTNELLAYSFRYFGEIERAVVIVDSKGNSIGEGIVEYSKKQSALYAIKRCHQECFILTAYPKPVTVEPYEQQDHEEGFPEKSVNKNSIDYKEERDIGPRFAPQGSFEHNFALKWKELFDVERQKKEALEKEIQEAREYLKSQIEHSKLEHDEIQLRNQLKQLADTKMKLQQIKDQTGLGAQQREEHRRQQEMFIRQREEDVLRRQQLGDHNEMRQQESSLRSQANNLHDILNNRDHQTSIATNEETSEQAPQPGTQSVTTQIGSDAEVGMPISTIGMMNQQLPVPQRTFAESAMMALNNPSFTQMQQQMGMPTPIQNTQMTQPNMYATFMQPHQHMNPQAHHQMQMQMDASGGFIPQNQVGGFAMMHQPQQIVQDTFVRQNKQNRQQQANSGNNVEISTGDGSRGGARPKKRGRF